MTLVSESDAENHPSPPATLLGCHSRNHCDGPDALYFLHVHGFNSSEPGSLCKTLGVLFKNSAMLLQLVSPACNNTLTVYRWLHSVYSLCCGGQNSISSLRINRTTGPRVLINIPTVASSNYLLVHFNWDEVGFCQEDLTMTSTVPQAYWPQYQTSREALVLFWGAEPFRLSCCQSQVDNARSINLLHLGCLSLGI